MRERLDGLACAGPSDWRGLKRMVYLAHSENKAGRRQPLAVRDVVVGSMEPQAVEQLRER